MINHNRFEPQETQSKLNYLPMLTWVNQCFIYVILTYSKLQFIAESVVKYFDAKLARIWLVDRERKYLMLKFNIGKYKNIQGEFSKVPLDSNKIGPIVKTKKPAISNDVVNDPRIRHPEWAKEEKLNPLPDILLCPKVNP
jgi:hypothetical protein